MASRIIDLGPSSEVATPDDMQYKLHAVSQQDGRLHDRASNYLSVSSATTLTLPPAIAGHLRDFIVRIDLTSLAAAPEITFAAPTGDTVTFETEDGAMPDWEAGKVNLVSFTETVAGKLAVAHKVVQEVA